MELQEEHNLIEKLIPYKFKSGLGYDISIGHDLGSMIDDVLSGDIFCIVDENIYYLYNDKYHFDRLGKRVYILKSGERSKCFKQVEKITQLMLSCGCNRHTKLVAVGGGVTGDLSGFIAAIYMRGIKVVHVPTTLLSCVDSSVGGKTGINLGRYKNMVGAFYQPSQIIISLDFLKTLPPEEIRCGLGEIVKTSLLERNLFGKVNENILKIISLDEDVLLEIVKDCVSFKDKITSADEKESSLRKILNLGHTVGHGLENMDKFRLSHGEYVLKGIEIEIEMARKKGIIDKDYYKDIKKVLDKVMVPNVKIKNISALVDIMKTDKKNLDNKIDFVFPKSIGETQEVLLEASTVKNLIEAVL